MTEPRADTTGELRLALVRLRHGVSNALVLTDVAHDQKYHLSHAQMVEALWASLLETQQLITDVLPRLEELP